VLAEIHAPKATIQLRKRKLFPNAPSWNPAHKLQLPAVKIWTGKYATKKTDLTPSKSSLSRVRKSVTLSDPVKKKIEQLSL
jgi:hypothetical protein